MIDLNVAASTEPATQYGPFIFWIIIGAVPFIIAFSVYIVKQLNLLNVALAVLVSETRPTIKLVNEVIDLKLASAELDTKVNQDLEHRVSFIENRLASWTTMLDEDTMNRREKS